MKKLLTLAVISLMFLGAVAAQETDRNNEVCGDTVCETAEELGLYSEIEQIDRSIDEVSSVLERCGTEYCKAVAENADSRQSLIQQADRSSKAGEMEGTSETLKEIEVIIREDIQASEGELDNGRTEPEIVDNVLTVEKRLLALTQSAITSSEEASGDCPERCNAGDRCPERCMDQTDDQGQDVEDVDSEVGVWPPHNATVLVSRASSVAEVGQIVFREGQVSLRGFGSFSTTGISSGDRPEIPGREMIAGTSSFYQTVHEDGDISCSATEGAIVCTSQTAGEDGNIYCWGKNEHCRTDNSKESTGVEETRLHCSGDRCPAEAIECPVCGELEREAESEAFKCGDGVCTTRVVGGEEVQWEFSTEGNIRVLAAAQSGSETMLALSDEVDKSSPYLMMSIHLDEDSDGDGVSDADADADGLPDLVERDTSEEWILPGLDMRAELSSSDGKVYSWGDARLQSALENNGEIYCWGSNRCVIREEVERKDSNLGCEIIEATMGNRDTDDCDDEEAVRTPETEPENPGNGDEETPEVEEDVEVEVLNNPPTAEDRANRSGIRDGIERITRLIGNIFR